MEYITTVVKVRLWCDPMLGEWTDHIIRASRYVCHRAVLEYLFGGMRERVTVNIPDTFQLLKRENWMVSGDLEDMWYVDGFDLSTTTAKNELMLKLMVWRREHMWLHDCPVAYECGAIVDAVTACRRVIDDNSNRIPYWHNDGRIILSSIKPPVRLGDYLIRVPGYGTVATTTAVDPDWNMRSFKIVSITDKVACCTTPHDRKFEMYITIRVRVDGRQPAISARDMDVGGHHLPATAYTDGTTALHDNCHKQILQEIDALKGLRARSTKWSGRWYRLGRHIHQLRRQADGITDDTIRQVVSTIAKKAGHISVEDLSSEVGPDGRDSPNTHRVVITRWMKVVEIRIAATFGVVVAHGLEFVPFSLDNILLIVLIALGLGSSTNTVPKWMAKVLGSLLTGKTEL